MLSHISIRNFAIIESLNLDLRAGLNVLTGETGAGKSIIIEAIHMALGGRADSTYVRSGAERAQISLAFDWEDPSLAAFLEENGLPAESPLLILREISANGKSQSRVGGQPVPLSLLKQLCARLVDIHGQYDHQSLLQPEKHLELVDLFGGAPLLAEKEALAEAYRAYSDCARSLKELKDALARAQRQKEFLEYQLAELQKAALQEGEDERLFLELQRLQNSEKIRGHLSEAYQAFFASDGLASLQHSLRLLEEISSYAPEYQSLAEALGDCCYRLEDDLSPSLRRLRDAAEASPERLEEVSARLAELDRLKRKYAADLPGLLALEAQIASDLESIEDSDQRIAGLEAELEERRALLEERAGALGRLRRDAASTLCRQIEAQLTELNFKDAALSASFEEVPCTENGAERMEFLLSANRGEELRPLARIASGGEISRIMLAFKCILGKIDHIPTLIFDEIDSGISGSTAAVVGKKLKQVARDHQIICITHLPQIAACGAAHYKIEKQSRENDTITNVIPLDPDARVRELARLLGGLEIGEAALRNAADLLRQFADPA